jgi:hypothetical protein
MAALVISTNGAVEVNFNGNVILVDPAGVQAPLSKIIPPLVANMSASTFGQALLSTTVIVVTLPASPTQLLYAKHLGLTGTITFTWTPVGSASVQIMVIQPGGMLFFFNPTNGITALSVQASVANVPVDYVLAG